MCGGAVARSGAMGMCFVLLVRGGEKLEPLRRIALHCIVLHCIAADTGGRGDLWQLKERRRGERSKVLRCYCALLGIFHVRVRIRSTLGKRLLYGLVWGRGLDG